MPARLRSRLTFANVVSSLALFVALSGSAYAVTSLPKGSVGSTQLRRHAVSNSKLANNAVSSAKVRDGSLLAADFKAGQLPKGDPGAQGPQGERGAAGQDATKLFGYIDDFGGGTTAALEYGSGVTAVSDPAGEGNSYTVTFARSLANCVVIPTQGIGSPTSSASTLGVLRVDTSIGFSDPTKVTLTFYDNSSALRDTSFMIAAFC